MLLELSLFPSTRLGQNSHVTEKGCIENSHAYQYGSAKNNLYVGSGAHFIATKEENSVVEGANVLVEVRLAVEPIDPRVLPSVNEIKWWHPVLVLLHDKVPKRSYQVHAKDKFEH